jgi:hypothetical protein
MKNLEPVISLYADYRAGSRTKALTMLELQDKLDGEYDRIYNLGRWTKRADPQVLALTATISNLQFQLSTLKGQYGSLQAFIAKSALPPSTPRQLIQELILDLDGIQIIVMKPDFIRNILPTPVFLKIHPMMFLLMKTYILPSFQCKTLILYTLVLSYLFWSTSHVQHNPILMFYILVQCFVIEIVYI